ncbi:MAG: acyl-CoA dehydrogenase [Alphaproteobacteria bacterium]|nr:acyl-CoA dehydrogenase [Alphaproteobacteria bacterium]
MAIRAGAQEPTTERPVSDCLARARGVTRVLRAETNRIEAARELTPAALEAMHEARLFRLLLPASLGGEELDPVTLSQVTEVIAAADASAAWCLGQGSGCAMAAAYLSAKVARQVFGQARDVLAWGAGAQGRAVAEAGGYRVTGTWHFASGSRHATWLGGHCKVFEADGRARLRADGRQVERTALFRRAEARIIDNWQVMGLRGTGSDGFSVDGFFAAEEMTIDRENDDERREAATLYLFPATLVYAPAFAGVAIGIARATLDDLLALAKSDKTPRGARTTLKENPVFQTLAAELEAGLRSGRAYVSGSVAEVWRAVGASRELTLDQRMAIRLSSTFVINQMTDLVARAYRAAGATAIFDDNPFERRFRDAHAVSQQAQARTTHYETVGRHLLGLPPDTLMFL